MEKSAAYIKLTLLPEVGAVTARRLLEKFGSPENVFSASKDELLQVEKIGEKVANAIIQKRQTIDAAPMLEKMKKLNAEYVHIESPQYPPLLKRLEDKPIGLYKLGSANLSAPCVAIVGSRRCSVYGLSTARKFAATFARAGITVVSGLARGIDTAAHTGALEAGGATIAVLGCGVDIVYPPENVELYRKIIANGGAVVSEFPISARVDKQNFPMRNRIISGLSLATIVIESDEHGGSMITARVAGEQGRDVFAVPGRIDSPSSRGCHTLIRDGVTLASCAEDVIDALSFSNQIELSFVGGTEKKSSEQACAPQIKLEGDESKIVECFADSPEIDLNTITEKSGLPTSKCLSTLLMLEIKKVVKKTAAATWIKRY